MQPINYLPQGVPDPFGASMLGAYKAGVDMQQVQFAQQQQQQALAAAQAKAEREAFVQQRLSEFMGKDPKTLRLEDYQAVTPLLPKEQADSLRANFELQSKEQQNAQLSFGGQVMAAFQADQPQIGIQLLRERAQAERNSNKEDSAKFYDTAAQLAETVPDQALKNIGAMIAALPGGGDVVKAVIEGSKGPATVTQAEGMARKAVADATTAEATAAVAAQAEQLGLDAKVWEIADKKSLIEDRAARLNFDADKAYSEYLAKLEERGAAANRLPESAVTIINNATMASVVAEQTSASMENLANDLERIDKESFLKTGVGAFSSAGEAFAKATGRQDELTRVRQEYTRLRNKMAVGMLPPGSSTDRDIQIFMQPFPTETADAAYLASFLRGMAKTQRREAVVETAKADWAEANGGMLRNKKDTVIAGVRVPAGARFESFVQQFAERKASERKAESDIGSLQTRPYMRWATPGAGQ